MIQSKKDLREYLNADKNNRSFWVRVIQFLTGSEAYLPCKFIRTLRYYEYYLNKRKNIFDYPFYFWYMLKLRRLKIKTNYYICPNTLGKGVELVHPGFIRMSGYVHVGENATILPMVLFGKRVPGIKNPDIFVGDNVYISTGVTILGPVKIGNNVTIGAGAVVTKDIPDNAVVGGVPAKIIKIKEVDLKK